MKGHIYQWLAFIWGCLAAVATVAGGAGCWAAVALQTAVRTISPGGWCAKLLAQQQWFSRLLATEHQIRSGDFSYRDDLKGIFPLARLLL
ncbi:hypothetical protein [Pseudomonas sp. LFM046]|uniref:hypothetical protein n=1 Tax=Pseudomonas sp. LFM046 TaxID=1608357 RepID=UPI0011AEF746|nr:hypothetical protein [Pseudomonas sp. LFM046]